jgi:hypothetical protein
MILSYFLLLYCAGIFKQSMGARNRVGIIVVVPARQATQPGGIGSLKLILGLLKSLKIRALYSAKQMVRMVVKDTEISIQKDNKFPEIFKVHFWYFHTQSRES